MPQTQITDAYIDEIIKAPDAYNPTLNKTQGVKLRELIKLMRDKLDQPGGGGALLSTVSYAELVSLVSTSTLVPGAQYLLSDYKMYWKCVAGNTELREADNLEPLILSAVSPNKISSSAKSTIYPNDVIYYTLGRFDYDGNVIPYSGDNQEYLYHKGVVPVKGFIYRRIDENRKLDINFDYKGFWVENGDYHLPIEANLQGNVSIIQIGLDGEYARDPIIIPFAALKNTKITIGFNGAYAGNADQLCPAAYTELKLSAYNSEIDFSYIQDDNNNNLKPQLVVKDSKLTKLFWIPSTPGNWNKVLNFGHTAVNYSPYPGYSFYDNLLEVLAILANSNVKVSVDYNWVDRQYSILEMKTALSSTAVVPANIQYFQDPGQV